MYLLVLAVGLLVFFAVCAVAIFLLKPKNPGRVWRAIFALVIVVGIADHLVGYLYARIWVWMAKGDATRAVHSDSVAYKYSRQPLYKTWYDPLGDKNFDPWPPGTPREVYASFLAWQAAAGFSVVQGYPKSYAAELDFGQPLEVRISTDPNDPACRWWELPVPDKARWIEDRIDKKKWLEQVRRNWDDGARAACPALHPIPRITARHLSESLLNMPATALEQALGLSEFERRRIIDLERNEVVFETRAVKFQGGWVAQFLSIGYEFGLGSLFARRFRTEPWIDTNIVPVHRPRVGG